MKALVAEIHKDHIIVITRDGRFVRQDVPAGVYEIGDEIVVDDAELSALRDKPVKKPFGMFARLAAGFAAIVILGGGSYLGIKYAGAGFASGPVMVASQEPRETIAGSSGQEKTDEAYQTLQQSEGQALAAEAPASESGIAGSQSLESSTEASKSAQKSSASNQDSGQPDNTQATQDSGAASTSGTDNEENISLATLPVLFEETFKLEKNNIDVLTDCTDLFVTYRIEQLYSQDAGNGEMLALTIKIKNLQKSTFNGNIDIIFTDTGNNTLQTSEFEKVILGFNGAYEQQVPVAAGAESFGITLYGSFDET